MGAISMGAARWFPCLINNHVWRKMAEQRQCSRYYNLFSTIGTYHINPYFGDLAPIALVLLACFNSEALQFLTNDPSHCWCSTRVCSHCSHTLSLAKFYRIFTVQHATLVWMLCAEICQVLDLVWIPDSSTRPARHLLAGLFPRLFLA